MGNKEDGVDQWFLNLAEYLGIGGGLGENTNSCAALRDSDSKSEGMKGPKLYF